MKNKILTIFLVTVLISCCFINNSIFATTDNNTITAVCNTSNPHNGETLTYILPEDINTSSHMLVCWSGVYGKWCLYVARNWTDNTVFRLDSTYKYLFAYDKKLDATYDFDVYVYQSGTDNLPTFDKTAKNLYWNGLIYENGGIPNISITTDNVYFADNSLCNVASSDISFFFRVLTLEEVMKQAGAQANQAVGQTILVVIVATVGLIIFVIGLRKGLTALMSGLRN